MNGQKGWIESIKKLPAFVRGAIGFVTLVVGFIVFFRDNVHLGIIVSATLTLITAFCLCIYLAFARTPPLVEGGRGIYRFERYRPWAFVGILLALVLFVAPLVTAPTRSFVITAFVGPVTPTPPPTTTPTLTPTTDAAYTPPPVAVSPVPPRPAGWIFYDVAKPVEYQDIKPSNLIKLRQFELLRSATSFVETEEPLFAAGSLVKTYAMDNSLMMHLANYGCTGEIDSALPRIREALQHYAEQRGRSELLPYIETEEQVVTLARDNPDIASKLVPQSSEWRELSDSDYDAYILWLSHCVGIPFPTFNVTVENLSDQEQLITKVLYRTVETGQVMGGLAGALSPEATYVHEIGWMSGDQEASLVPPFSIPPKSSGSFALQLTMKSGDCGLGWLMEIYFIIDEERGAVSTDQFQLIMSGPACGK